MGIAATLSGMGLFSAGYKQRANQSTKLLPSEKVLVETLAAVN
jgi:hypothetical protein